MFDGSLAPGYAPPTLNVLKLQPPVNPWQTKSWRNWAWRKVCFVSACHRTSSNLRKCWCFGYNTIVIHTLGKFCSSVSAPHNKYASSDRERCHGLTPSSFRLSKNSVRKLLKQPHQLFTSAWISWIRNKSQLTCKHVICCCCWARAWLSSLYCSVVRRRSSLNWPICDKIISVSMKAIFAVINTTSAVVKIRPEKIQACTGFEPTTGLNFFQA